MPDKNENKSRIKDIPVWQKYLLSTEEASAYFHIGINKLRRIISPNPTAEFVFWNGSHKKVDLLDVKQLVGNADLLNEVLKDGIKIYG